MGKLKVLFVASDPDPAGQPLNIHEEMRRIQERIRASDHRDAVEFAYAVAARPLDLIQALNIHRPHAVHFSGHGDKDGAFVFTGGMGERRPVGPELLADVFRKVRGGVRLVVINACESKAIAQAVSAVVECAVGMRRPIEDNAAIVFSEMFYGALGFALSVQEAFDQGTLAIAVDNRPGSDVPELFSRPDVDPLRVILVSSAPHTPCEAAVRVVCDEVQRNLVNLAAQVTHVLTDVPTGDPVPRRPGETQAAFDDRDRRWFTHAVSDMAEGFAQFTLDTGGYDAHRLNLAECPEMRRTGAERAYAALDEVKKRLSMYRARLRTLADGSHTPERRAEWTGLYSRQAANALAILWCQMLEGWMMLEPEEAQASAVTGLLVPQVLGGVEGVERFSPGAEDREFVLRACAVMHGRKAALIEEEMRLQASPEPLTPSSPLDALAAAAVAYAEGRPADAVTAFEWVFQFPKVSSVQRRFARTSLAFLRDPERYGGVLGTYLLFTDEGGAAEQAGLQSGDTIIAYHGTPVTGPDVLARLISQAHGAPLVEVELVREGERMVRFIKGGASLLARGTTLVIGDSVQV